MMKKKLVLFLLLSTIITTLLYLQNNESDLTNKVMNAKDKCFVYLKNQKDAEIKSGDYEKNCSEFEDKKDDYLMQYKDDKNQIDKVTRDLLDEIMLFNSNNPKINELAYSILSLTQTIDPDFTYTNLISQDQDLFANRLLNSLLDTEDIKIEKNRINNIDKDTYVISFNINDSAVGYFTMYQNNVVKNLKINAIKDGLKETNVDMIYAAALAIISADGFNNDNIDIEKFFDRTLKDIENIEYQKRQDNNLQIITTKDSIEISYVENTTQQI